MNKTKKLSTLAMLCAIAYIVVFFGRIPMVMFLKYDPKDVIIAIGGMIYGPMSAFIISVTVSLVEMVTISSEGVVGFLMNVLSSCAFACVAAYIYKKDRTLRGAIIGLSTGVIAMVSVMILWNYLITPLYLGISRQAVVKMLVTVFLPFNLIKGALNGAITMLLYKRVVFILRKLKLVSVGTAETKSKGINIGVISIAVAVIITAALFALAINNII